MFNLVSKSDKIQAKLQLEGKVSLLNLPDDIAAINAMNKSMENVRRDFKAKDEKSQQKAAGVKLTS
ncbi:hypothetical protein JW887_05880 [Candidatus Dojkabacteria bacterium]|nr:hypothetical protein [Candidatus Dojkabacteria bacterium]